MTDSRQIPSAQVVMELMLHEAAANGDDKRIEELQVYLKRGKISVNQADVEWGNRTPLHCAAERGNPRCVRLLLESGANPYARMVGGWTPAHCAAEAGHCDILQTLIDFQTPVDIKDDNGDRPRHIAEIYGQNECVTLLKRAEKHPVGQYSFKSKRLWGTVQSFTEDIQESVRQKTIEKK
ncbi:ankyrin repeat domain-containing protein 66-like [Dendronephthya gigantea]|uniref:ankyrin repeat domain-containing protein 66-like n=1 Tax=Dendronephthya gigantea TaxID=151771 RepID=UPI00106A85D0|nr:ankyrin repeat domain-containing protein 66-like [Dendronephthya gigantea]XP_028406304.1 ankyrin repeat domain-containing protein 66-like [Dendronephthya gigantea]XP_028406305.1 ankyrin repeat domain-containing protein 66-like [Dendronephthya gigantea]